jgi:hypothetical protein
MYPEWRQACYTAFRERLLCQKAGGPCERERAGERAIINSIFMIMIMIS